MQHVIGNAQSSDAGQRQKPPPSNDGQPGSHVHGNADPREHARHVAVATYDQLRHGHTVSDALHGALDAFEQVLMTAGVLTLPEAPQEPLSVAEIHETARWLAQTANHPRTLLPDAWEALLDNPAAVEFAVHHAMRQVQAIPGMADQVRAASAILAAHQQGR